jgi:hypothetical protein
MAYQSTLPQQLERVVFALCEDTDTPRALTVKLLVQYQEYEQLVRLTIDSEHYLSPERYYQDAVVTEFLRKYGDFDIKGIDKGAVAISTFFKCEKACHETNLRLAPFLHNGPFEDPSELRLFESIERMQRWISKVLGPIPEELVYMRHGPGATFRDIGQLTTVPDKMSNRPTMTQGASLLLPLWESTAWAKAYLKSYPQISRPEYIRGNRFTSVYKDALKNRGICIEGSVNVYFQLGIGGAMRLQLKKIGIDIETAQDRHRWYAMVASRAGNGATIDLSNASDMNALNCTRLLLAKSEWLPLLESVRSPFTMHKVRGKDRWYRLEKFSSMGNGYTFELETLIFLAIAMEGCYLSGLNGHPGQDVHVFGDDMIVPSQAGPTILQLLKWFGFQPNIQKTFLSGPFRESCGGDFFEGKAVRPHYLKDEPNEPANWISLANGLRRLGRKDGVSEFRYSIYWRAWLRALDAIPSDIRRIRGPDDLGDLVIHDEREFWQKRRTPELKSFIRTWAPVPKVLKLHHWKDEIVFACSLYGIPSDGVVPRKRTRDGDLSDQVSGYRKRWTAYPL